MICCWPNCERIALHLVLSGMRPWQVCNAHKADALEYRPGSKVVEVR